MIVRRATKLTEVESRTLRALLDVAYDGDFGEDDWLHALGGRHVLAYDQSEMIAHASVVERVLLHHERRWRTGYVEALAVAPWRRRRGVGSTVMAQIESIIQSDFELGALSASDLAMALYERRGWRRWRGTTWVQLPEGPQRTPDDDDSLFVWPVSAPVDLHGSLTCDFRSGDAW